MALRQILQKHLRAKLAFRCCSAIGLTGPKSTLVLTRFFSPAIMHADLDNSGDGPLRVPGFGGVPLDYELNAGKRFVHGIADWYRNPRLTKREVSMLRFMEYVTECPGWDDAIHSDQATITTWHAEASTKFHLSPRAWDWCQAELRDKALDFKKKGFVTVLDVDSPVVKSDVSISADLLKDLQQELSALLHTSELSSKQLEPSNQVRNLIDPSMYPLVYGRSSVLLDGGINWLDDNKQHKQTGLRPAPCPEKPPVKMITDRDYRARVKQFFWSNQFQWLPCEVEFPEGATKPLITSYINNLHPEHKGIYQAIERLIAAAIQPWNETLILGKQGRMPIRIRTYDVPELHKEENFWRHDDFPNLYRDDMSIFTTEEWSGICSKAKAYLSLPEYDWEIRVERKVPDEFPQDILNSMTPEQWNSPLQLAKVLDEKYRRRYIYEFPEPGVSFSYNDWKAGRNTGQPICGKVDIAEMGEPFDPEPDHEYYNVNLQDLFDGIQIIVKVSSIDLNPEQPSYAGDPAYQVAGLLNEHIVASAVCYYDVENIEGARISFQQEAHIEDGEFNIRDPWAIERVWDIPTFDYFGDESPPEALQDLGSISIPAAGRFIAWSNTLRYKAEAFRLKDPSRPGHLRYITLWLVDPHYRICSTRNVPPQQHSWWSKAALRAPKLSESLPAELVKMVDEQTDGWPMSPEVAREIREQTESEREMALEQLRGRKGTNRYSFWDTLVIVGF